MQKYILLFFTFILVSASTQAQTFTPFTWQYPKYGGHSLNKIRNFDTQKFIVVGDAGAIVISYDDGVTWTISEPFTQINLYGIFIKNSLTFFVSGSLGYGNGAIFKTIDAGNTWTQIFSNTSMPLKDINFANDSVGYCVGEYSKIVKTVDGGATWADITNNTNISGNLQTVWFLNSDTGYVGKTTSTAAMYKTTNGGLTWNQNFGYTISACYSIVFLNDTLGYAGGYNSKISRTTNGGLTWLSQTNFTTNEGVKDISFTSPTQGIAVTNSYIYKTSNGTTWSSPFYGGNHKSCVITNSSTAIATDLYGGLERSTNAGSIFTQTNPQSGLQTFKKIKFLNTQNGWVVGDGYFILKTANAGLTCTSMPNAPYQNSVSDMAAISTTKLVTVNSDGDVITTTNGGTTFTTQTLSTTNGLNGISFPTPTTGYIVGNAGTMYKTTNGGTSYTTLTSGIASNLTKVFFSTASTGYALSNVGHLLKTINSGTTWTNIPISGIGTFKQLHFLDANKGYFVNDNGTAFRTIDGCATIDTAGQACIQTAFDMQFINDSTGFISGGGYYATCDVSYTTDYGNTWSPIIYPYAYTGWGVYAFDTANVYLVGQQQTILKTGANLVITNLTPTLSKGEGAVRCYPNPAKDVLFVEGHCGLDPQSQLDYGFRRNDKPNSAITRISIVDVLGNEVATSYISGNTSSASGRLGGASFNIQHLKSGIYFVKVANEVVKFVKE